MARVISGLAITDLERLVAAYRRAGQIAFTPRARELLQASVVRIETAFDELAKKIGIRFVTKDPYATYAQMRSRVLNERLLYVCTTNSIDTTLWDPIVNWKFRAVHDWKHMSADGAAPVALVERALQDTYADYYSTFEPGSIRKREVPPVARVDRVSQKLLELEGFGRTETRAANPRSVVWFMHGLYGLGGEEVETFLHLDTVPQDVAVILVAAAKALTRPGAAKEPKARPSIAIRPVARTPIATSPPAEELPS